MTVLLDRAIAVPLRRDSAWAAISRHHLLAMGGLMVFALAFWVWFGLSQRSVVEDEVISLLAAIGVAEKGYMELPSGHLYHRGYIPHYLLGGLIKLFGVNELSIRLPGLLFGLASLWLVYLFGRDVIGRAWVGVLAAAVLLATQEQTFYATSSRMYMPLQVFVMLSAYCAWRGFVQDIPKFRMMTPLAMAAAVLTHEQAVLTAVAAPAAAFLASWLAGLRLRGVFRPEVAAGGALVLVTGWFTMLYTPQDLVPAITSYSGPSVQTVFGLNLNLLDWARQTLTPIRTLAYLAAFGPAIVFLLVAVPYPNSRRASPGASYAILTFAFSGVLLIIGTPRTDVRFWFFILPLYALALTAWGVLAGERIGLALLKRAANRPATVLAGMALCVVSLAALGIVFASHLSRPLELANEVLGMPCRGWNCDRSIEEHYAAIADRIGPEDTIVSSNPFVTYYYLGRVDAYLKDKTIAGADGQLQRLDYLEDEYFKIPVVDEYELRHLAGSEAKVWVVTDLKVYWNSSDEVQVVLRDEYQRQHSDALMTTYVNRP